MPDLTLNKEAMTHSDSTTDTDTSTSHKPKWASVEEVLMYYQNKFPIVIGLPGNWSPTLWLDDLNRYPVTAEETWISVMIKSNAVPMSYGQYFLESRGYTRAIVPGTESVWAIFETTDKIITIDGIRYYAPSNLMLYFEKWFLLLIQKTELTMLDNKFLETLRELGKLRWEQWEPYVEKYGACSINFFINDPMAYIRLIYDTNANNTNGQNKLETMGDFALAKQFKIPVPKKYGTRENLLTKCYNLLQSASNIHGINNAGTSPGINSGFRPPGLFGSNGYLGFPGAPPKN